jgi:signal transduction histidine kinase/ActR/RegA family two-component response regulator
MAAQPPKPGQSKNRGDARSAVLASIDDALRPLTDARLITKTAATIVGQYMGVNRCAYADVEADQDTFNLSGDYNNGVDSIVGRYTFAQFGAECLRLMRADEPYIVNDSESDPRCVEVLASYRLTKIRSVICVPLHKEGRFVAAMAVHMAMPRVWTEAEVDLLLGVANRCWESIERTRIERTLREANDLLAALLATTSSMIAVIRPDMRFSMVNAAFRNGVRRIFGVEVDVGVDVIEATKTRPTDQGELVGWWQRALAGESLEPTTKLADAKGDVSVFEMRFFPLREADGRIIGAALVANDVTARHHEEQMQRALAEQRVAYERTGREEAERLGRMKDEFLATLSHELRTPLNAILGWAQLIRLQGDTSEDVASGLGVIERNARVQAQLVDDLLDMNRIVSGKLRIEPRTLDIARALFAAIDTMRPAAEAKGVTVESTNDVGHALSRGDPARLQQVFWNLLNNAIKFTPRGGTVRVAIRTVQSRYEITVSDTGVGIGRDFLPFVFERFRQADSSSTRSYGGLGLGLSIAKELVELHGGTIRVDSAGRGEGTTFTVRLPITSVDVGDDGEGLEQASETPLAAIADTRMLEGTSVLVVDDEPDASSLVKRVLEQVGADVTVAGSADEALSLWQRNRFDILVSDIGMPDRDGYDLIRALRALPREKASGAPAVALTAFARAEDRRRALVAGYNSHVPKPVEAAELVTVVASLAGKLPRS